MFHKILVAIDASDRGQMVFNEALSLAKATAANLMLLHVLSSEEEVSPNISMCSRDSCETGRSRLC